MDKRFTGMIPPVVTPFTAEGEVDLEALDRVIEHLIEGGMNGPVHPRLFRRGGLPKRRPSATPSLLAP